MSTAKKALPAQQPTDKTAAKVIAQQAAKKSVLAKPVAPSKPLVKSPMAKVKAVNPKTVDAILVKAPAVKQQKTKLKVARSKLVKPLVRIESDKLRLFQIYYRPEQRATLDTAFEPYNNQGEKSPLLEYNVFRKLAKSKKVIGADLWGALSWKFQEKTGLSGADLRKVIAANPGHDAYYCNPHPEFEALYHNLWLQGETAHPNFLVLCREFFEAAGIPLENLNAFLPSSLFASANYFIASPKFWADYFRFVDTTIYKAESGMSTNAKIMLYSQAADPKIVHAGASYVPFIVERLFSIFLNNNHKKYSTYKYALPVVEEKLNVHLKLLKQMKDLSINTKSLWMASCWVNYRNLYMSNAYGAEWCKKFLKAITPIDFMFNAKEFQSK